MKKWVRWWGLIAFAGVVGSMVLFWLVFADGLVRRIVEKAGTALVGAEVDIGSADVSFSPLGVTLHAIEVTDPESPANNRVQIGRTAFSLDGLLLLRRKVIIREMAVETVRFNVPRKRPGRVTVPPLPGEGSAGAAQAFTLPSVDLPSARSILASEDLASLKIIEQAKADLQKAREEWTKRQEELPDKAKLDAYRERLKTLKGSTRGGIKDIAKSASGLRDLKRDLDQDSKRVREAKRSFADDLARSKASVAGAVRSPSDDVRRIKEKYGLSSAGLQNASRALFGAKITSWVDTGLLWYERLRPLMTRDAKGSGTGSADAVKPLRAAGVDVRFRERAPRPDLLVSLVNASLQPAAGSLEGTIRNITPDQDVLGAPLTFAFSGRDLKDADHLSLEGNFDHVRPSRTVDAMRLQVQGYRASGLSLSSNTDLPVTLQQGQVDIDLTGRSDGTKISARLTATVRDARLETGGSGGSVVSALRTALSRVSRFTVTANITGTPDDYQVSVSSDLDRVLKDAAGKAIGDPAAAFEKDLQAAIQERTGGAVKDLQADLGGLDAFGGNFDRIEGQLADLLKDAGQGAGGKFKLPF